MSQVISFKVAADISESVQMFLEAWEAVGSWKQGGGDFFELSSVSGESCHLYLNETEISFQGQFSGDGLSLIEGLASAHGAELFYEGELFSEAEQLEAKTVFKPQWNGSFKIGTMTRVKAIVIALIAIPVVIVLIPIAIVMTIVRLLFFIIFKGKGIIK